MYQYTLPDAIGQPDGSTRLSLPDRIASMSGMQYNNLQKTVVLCVKKMEAYRYL